MAHETPEKLPKKLTLTFYCGDSTEDPCLGGIGLEFARTEIVNGKTFDVYRMNSFIRGDDEGETGIFFDDALRHVHFLNVPVNAARPYAESLNFGYLFQAGMRYGTTPDPDKPTTWHLTVKMSGPDDEVVEVATLVYTKPLQQVIVRTAA